MPFPSKNQDLLDFRGSLFLEISYVFSILAINLGTCLVKKQGGTQRKPCIFPFMVLGRSSNGLNVTYDTCTHILDPDGRFWCSTKVDENGVHQSGNWGHCDQGDAQGDCPLPL